MPIKLLMPFIIKFLLLYANYYVTFITCLWDSQLLIAQILHAAFSWFTTVNTKVVPVQG